MSTLQIVYPPELAELKKNPKVIFMAPGDYPQLCLNCGGLGVMMAYRVDAGPFPQPAGRGSKWLEIDGRAGWCKGELLVGHCPVCQTGRLQIYLERLCGLEGRDLTTSLAEFRTDGILSEKAPALQIARSYLAMNRTPAGFLTFLGDRHTSHGVGKSHLMKGMVNGFRAIGVWSRYTTLADLLADWHDHFGKDAAVRTEELLELHRTIRVLAIDEIDKVDLTGWDRQTFFRLIDARHTQADQLLTILAANAYLEDDHLQIWRTNQWGATLPAPWPADLDYLASRIAGGVVATLPGPDYRMLQGHRAAAELNQ